MISRVELHPAFVLHTRPYRETSLLVDLLTREHGRVSGVAKGVKSARRPSSALFQPFRPLVISWGGRGELVSIHSIEAAEAPFQLRGDGLLSAFYLNELLVRLLDKQDPCPGLYTLYSETLLELQKEEFQEKTLRVFEKKLLKELGYGLQLQYDVPDGNPIDLKKCYYFCLEQGFKLLQDSNTIAKAYVFSGKSLIDFATEQWEDDDSLRDAKRLMRLAFAPLLGKQPLHSRKLFIKEEV